MFIAPFAAAIDVRADDWPQWSGPNREGVCGETSLLQSFLAGGLMVRWRVPAGWGSSNPVVAAARSLTIPTKAYVHQLV
jgi:hypothetical protein